MGFAAFCLMVLVFAARATTGALIHVRSASLRLQLVLFCVLAVAMHQFTVILPARRLAINEHVVTTLLHDAAATANTAPILVVGIMYGAVESNTEATSWYRKAADQGDAHGQNNLGLMYAKGRGVAKDEAEAVSWYRKAADQGNADGQNNLGRMYEWGRGVAKDEAEAVSWYRKAAEQGDADGQNNLGFRKGLSRPHPRYV
jgi:TPR repeat protein